MSPSLVFAIIRTESNFNPYAVSSAPAYGLMQLVPTSGGREAYRRAKGEDVAPTRDYLFDPQNNVELGTAYLNVLMFNQLEEVANEVSREYCVIAAYNTGPGNVLRTFSKNRTNRRTADQWPSTRRPLRQVTVQSSLSRNPQLSGKGHHVQKELCERRWRSELRTWMVASSDDGEHGPIAAWLRNLSSELRPNGPSDNARHRLQRPSNRRTHRKSAIHPRPR